MLKLVFVLGGLVAVANGYAAGAPKEACGDMIPQHHTPPQNSKSPYTINANYNKGNGLVKITIRGPEPFKGFLVQGRVGDQPIGAFVNPAKNVKIIDCGSGRGNAATHTDSGLKNEVTLLWKPPPKLAEQVQFRATVAKDGGTFWVGTLSNRVRVN